MKRRLRKKLGLQAKALLIEYGIAKAEDFTIEDDEIQYWYQSGGLEPEWDYTDVLSEIRMTVLQSYCVFTDDGECQSTIKQIKNTPHLFNLFRAIPNDYKKPRKLY